MPETGSTGRTRTLLWAVVSLVLIGLAGRYWLFPVSYGGDPTRYLEPIHALLAGGSYNQVALPPGLGLLSLVPFVFVRNIPLSGTLVAFASYLGILLLSYHIASSLKDPSAGWFAAFTVGTTPFLLSFSNTPLSETPFTFFLLLVAWLTQSFDRKQHPGYWHAVALGASMGMLYLIRPEGTLICILVVGFLMVRLIWARRKGSASSRNVMRKGRAILVVSVVCACISLPYVAFLYNQTGELTISGKSKGTFFEYAASATMSEEMRRQEKKASSILDYIEKNPYLFAMRVKYNVVSMLRSFYLVNWHVLLVLCVFILPLTILMGRKALSGFDRSEFGRASLLILFMMPLASYLMFFVTERFLIPYSVLFQILVAVLTATVIRSISQFKPVVLWCTAVTLVLFGLSSASHNVVRTFAPSSVLPMTLLNVLSKEELGNREFTLAGEWLKENVSNPESIRMASPSKGHVALFFAGDVSRPSSERIDRWLNISGTSVEEGLASMRSHDTQYLVLDRSHTRHLEPWRKLWNRPKSAVESGLVLLHHDPSDHFQVYQVLD